jgi:hypothetical protein
MLNVGNSKEDLIATLYIILANYTFNPRILEFKTKKLQECNVQYLYC